MASATDIANAVRVLASQGLVAFPTETVYGLGADAESALAVERIYQAKGRPSNHPVIVHVTPEADLLYWAASVPPEAQRLIDAFWPGPLTLILKRAKNISSLVSGGQDSIGLRCPSHPVAQALLREFAATRASGQGGVAAPSANKFGQVSPTTSAHVRSEFAELVALGMPVLDGGASEVGIESTIVDLSRLERGIGPVLLRPGHITAAQLADVLEQVVVGPDAQAPRAEYWPADVHVIGKDITRFHAIFWPAFLMSAGLPVPRQIVVHGFLFNRGEKMSKSVGNVIDPFTMAEHYGVDQMRYFFLREVPFGQDGNYSHEAIVQRINADLANDLGNLGQRSLSMIAKNCGGVVPAPGAFTEADAAMLAEADALADKARAAMKDFALHTMLADIWRVVAEANRYFASEELWRLTKTDPARRDTVLYVTAETLRNVAIMAQPVIPGAAGKLLDLLGVSPEARTFAHAGAAGRLGAGAAMPAPAPIFPRYVEAEEGGSAPIKS